MKKGFTVIELLVVIGAIITLMAITFRLAGTAGEQSKRNTTISRMQRLENCLSGYFAAFGSYPPVPLHAQRNPYMGLDNYGNQDGTETGSLEWSSVNVACRAQPVAARFPFSSNLKEYVALVSRTLAERASSSDSRFEAFRKRANVLTQGFTALDNPNQLGSDWSDKSSWQEVKIFQFGLMSFLLPRYLFMTSGIGSEFLDNCAQWTDNNSISANPNNGTYFGSWDEQFRDSQTSLLMRVPSQAVCARWMANLEGCVSCFGSPSFYGVKISDGSGSVVNADNPYVEVFKDSGGGQYVLDAMTITDGWGNEFYYYSAPPYQSYRLWSAGPNGKTFPPWIPLDSIQNATDRKTAANWSSDDVMYLSN